MLNVSEIQLRKYIEIFHSNLDLSAKNFLPDHIAKQLLHVSILPATIKGYISTQFGVAIEYIPADKTDVVIVIGSARVEYIMLDAPSKMRRMKPLFFLGRHNVIKGGVTIKNCLPFLFNNEDSTATISGIRLEFGAWRRQLNYVELFGDRRAEKWSVENALSRALDEVCIAKSEFERAKEKNVSLQYYIDHFKEKTVLLLGDYDADGLLRLGRIREFLEVLGYMPLLVREVPDHPHHNLPQKVVAIGAISRFVIVDDSSRSGHLMEVELCKQNQWVTVLLRAGGSGGSWMTAGASHLSNVILEAAYDPADPQAAVREAVKWAEKKLKELDRKWQITYPWRQTSK